MPTTNRCPSKLGSKARTLLILVSSTITVVLVIRFGNQLETAPVKLSHQHRSADHAVSSRQVVRAIGTYKSVIVYLKKHHIYYLKTAYINFFP